MTRGTGGADVRAAGDTVVVVLARLAVPRHAAAAMVRALAHTERAPATLAAC